MLDLNLNNVQDGAVATTGKRAQNRIDRSRAINEAALQILADEGVGGLTMHKVASRVECAVGTIYTYFPSKSALLASLQASAVEALTNSFNEAKALWSEALSDLDCGEATRRVESMARMIAMARLFVAWPAMHPRDFALLQMFLTTPGHSIDPDDLDPILPQVLTMIFDVSQLVEDTVQSGGIHRSGDPADDTLARTLRWAAGLDGSILIGGVSAPVESVNPEAFGVTQMVVQQTIEFLGSWGADSGEIAMALEAVEAMEDRQELLPVPS